MICFPNAKINLGLTITEKRSDGFHNIETVFYPIAWNDSVEVIEAGNNTHEFKLHLSGIPIGGSLQNNLLYKAYSLIKNHKPLPNIEVYLHKVIPMGAGLGGGSADAAFFINVLNKQFNLQLSEPTLTDIAQQLGSDCAFFMKNKSVYAHQKGDVFKELDLDLSKYYVAIVFPNVYSNTKEAYSLVVPNKSSQSVMDIIKMPITNWKQHLINGFESSIFKKYPIVEITKNSLYTKGAIYASMSGSGSAVFGIFNEKPALNDLAQFPHWIGKMI